MILKGFLKRVTAKNRDKTTRGYRFLSNISAQRPCSQRENLWLRMPSFIVMLIIDIIKGVRRVNLIFELFHKSN